jgi:hypothetical protein
MARLGWGAVALCALTACGSSGARSAARAQRGAAQPTASKDGFTYYGTGGGMAPDVWDVSADEAGNVYVAAGDTVLAKKRGDAAFQSLDTGSAGVTANCDAAGTQHCPVVSVAGGDAGVAYFGLKGLGTDGDTDPDFWLESGGADVFAFDGAKLTRTRHVHVAGWPHQFCFDHSAPPCFDGDATWEKGRRKCRQILRMAFDHRPGDHHGDLWMSGTHCTFSLLINDPARRGWSEPSPIPAGMEDRHAVWEHDHPAMTTWATINGVRQLAFLTGDSTAIAIDPTTGDPWAANETRTARKIGAGAVSDSWDAAMWPYWNSVGGSELGSYLDVWPDPRPADLGTFDALDPRWMDAVSSLSFCDDGTLWIASSIHGLARRSPDGSISYVALPDGLGNSATAVACDPSDGSVWVGFGWGGFGRWNGAWWTIAAESPPDYAAHAPVRSIQIDRWSTPRVVWIAHASSANGPGGVTRYDGK